MIACGEFHQYFTCGAMQPRTWQNPCPTWIFEPRIPHVNRQVTGRPDLYPHFDIPLPKHVADVELNLAVEAFYKRFMKMMVSVCVTLSHFSSCK